MTSPDHERAELLQQAIRLKKAAARSRTPDLPPRPADQAAHLGELQRGLWLAHQMDRRSPAYNLASAFRVRGPLDMVRLQQAFDEVVSRHRLLRSTFRVDRDSILQIVHPPETVPLEMLEVGEGEGLSAAVQEAREPFDLETGPLVRLRLIEEPSARERYLLLILHHILVDERSLEFLWKELAEAFDGRLSDAGPTVQYDDYVHWRRLRDRSKRQEEVDYWRSRLDPLPDDLRLPFEKPARPVDDAGAPSGKLLSRSLSLTGREGLRRLAAATGSTPFVVFAFAFRLLLQRYTHGQRIAFATPVSMRSHPATAKMMGYFLNPVVVSTLIDEERRLDAAIGDFDREMKEVLAHASVAFHSIAEALSPPRQRDRHPIFQAMFVYQENRPPATLGEARLESVTLDLGAPKFDLTLFVTEGERSLEVAVEYRADRFDDHVDGPTARPLRDAARASAGRSRTRPRPSCRCWVLQEQSRLRVHAQGAELDSNQMTLLPRQILDQVRRSPESPAVTCGGVRRSYGELSSEARSIAHALSAGGVKSGRSRRLISRSFGRGDRRNSRVAIGRARRTCLWTRLSRRRGTVTSSKTPTSRRF